MTLKIPELCSNFKITLTWINQKFLHWSPMDKLQKNKTQINSNFTNNKIPKWNIFFDKQFIFDFAF